MAEREIVGAEVGRKPDSNLIKVEGTKKGLRIGALVCWMLVIVMEVMFLGFIFWDKCSWMEQNIGFILFLILDSALIVSASLLWKKAKTHRKGQTSSLSIPKKHQFCTLYQ